MRWLGKSLFFALFLLGLFSAAGSKLWQQTHSGKNQLKDGWASTFFPLESDNWLTFDVPSKSGLFRFYTHAALRNDIGDATASYTLEYQWLDGPGKILEQRQHYIATRASALVSRGLAGHEDTPRPQRFYEHQRSLPSRDHALYFNASAWPQATTLRLRVTAMEQAIELVGIRPYQQFARPQDKMDIAWQRMSGEQREKLSGGSLYPSFLLSDYERSNLLSTYWKPIGPLGVLDRDYSIDTLYQLDSESFAPPPTTPIAAGLFADPDHWVSLVLDAAQARYRIAWLPLPDGPPPQRLQLQWQGVNFEAQRQWQDAINNQYWEGSLAEGLLQVIPDQAGIMKLYRWQDSQWQDITPQKRYTRAFFCQPKLPLNYQLAPGTGLQPLKIDARGYFREDEAAAPAPFSANIELRDGTGSIIYSRPIVLPTQGYHYQHFADAATVASQVFEPLLSYIDASSNSHILTIECMQPTLVSVYSRPPGQPVKRDLPQHQNHWHSYEDREPAWFKLVPQNVDTLIRQKRYASLLWYFRPRELDGLLASGDYSWQAITTTDPDALESQIFSSHTGDNQARMEGRSTAYQPVEGPTTLQFAGRSNEKQVRPSAIYLRESTQPEAVQVLIDNELALDLTIAGKSGRINLPPLSANRHQLEFRSGGTRWFVNNTAESGQTHKLRTAYSMLDTGNEGSSLALSIETSGAPQQVGLWLYAPFESPALDCRLELKGRRHGELQHEYSFQDYQYSLASDSYDLSQVLNRHEAAVRGPIRLVIPLREDLPPQTLAANIHCDQPGVLASAGLISQGAPAYQYFREWK